MPYVGHSSRQCDNRQWTTWPDIEQSQGNTPRHRCFYYDISRYHELSENQNSVTIEVNVVGVAITGQAFGAENEVGSFLTHAKLPQKI